MVPQSHLLHPLRKGSDIDWAQTPDRALDTSINTLGRCAVHIEALGCVWMHLQLYLGPDPVDGQTLLEGSPKSSVWAECAEAGGSPKSSVWA